MPRQKIIQPDRGRFRGWRSPSWFILAFVLCSLDLNASKIHGDVPAVDAEIAWQALAPYAQSSDRVPLPTWARQLATELPQTTAALLELDTAQRTSGPVPPRLRAACLMVSARVNRSAAALALATADGQRAGLAENEIQSLVDLDFSSWNVNDQQVLRFAEQMTRESAAVTDEQFKSLCDAWGTEISAALVLHLAFSNFFDRLLICLETPIDPTAALPPQRYAFNLAARFGQSHGHSARPPMVAPVAMETRSDRTDAAAVATNPEELAAWKRTRFDQLQVALGLQKEKQCRLPIPSWSVMVRRLPPGLMPEPNEIAWYRVVFGYAPELAAPFEVFLRTAGQEGQREYNRVLALSLFWITTKAVDCPYCMGHCEMNWQIAGLNADEIAARSRLLSDSDWSTFSSAEQSAMRFARTLSLNPAKVAPERLAELDQAFPRRTALLIRLNCSRYHYMTRISNGFQLPLERTNVFYDYYGIERPDEESVAKVIVTAEQSVVPLLSPDDCWEQMQVVKPWPAAPPPNWARVVAVHLPRTAAAMLELDRAQRTASPLPPRLRAELRWLVASLNRCDYSVKYALWDWERTEPAVEDRGGLTLDPEKWPASKRAAYELVQRLTVDAPSVSDELFATVRRQYGDQQTAAMVLLAAYGNFQDRLLLAFAIPLEDNGPLPPVETALQPGVLQLAPLLAAHQPLVPRDATARVDVIPEYDWGELTWNELQQAIEQQRDRECRLPVPTWETIAGQLPPSMTARPTRIVWNLVCFGYAPELAVPWVTTTRTMWAETKPDRIFEESLFWVQTRSLRCNYCMGHCEMLLAAEGLNEQAIQQRTQELASGDWTQFPAAEQIGYRYARKLTLAPWELTARDYRSLEQALGPETAMATVWWLCRGLYMTRVSDGFQLPLERDNVFSSVPRPAETSKPAKD